MKILVANDDGIRSPGLEHLVRMARNLGEVWVVAPSGQGSAMSQRVSVFGTLDLQPVPDYPVEGVRAWTVSGSPADCVKVALACVMPEKPDLVFSGINQGYNVGTDILYSGTIGVTMEALANGIPAMAFSTENGEDLRVADAWMLPLVRELLEQPIHPWEVWNLNFPSCDPDCLRGVLYDRFPSAMQFYHNRYTPEPLPGGSSRLTLWSDRCAEAEPGSDMQAVFDGYISVGRVRCALLQQNNQA